MQKCRFKDGGRILVGRLEISGYYRQLSAGLNELGVRHDYITYWRNPYGFGGETRSPGLLRLSERFLPISASEGQNPIRRVTQAFVRELLITAWAIGAIIRYDAFILGFGETLLRRNVDLIALRVLRKPVIVNMAHGSEGRPPYLDGSALQEGEAPAQQARRLAKLTKQTFLRVRRIERWATYVIGAPYSNSQFSKRKFINHFAIGIPYSLAQNQLERLPGDEPWDSEANRPTVVLHSPSNPAIKGTHLIKQALDTLHKAGYEVDYRVIAGRPNTEVLAALDECDLVVDQVYSDTPLAGFATEAAWRGRGTVVAGYALNELEAHIPRGMVPPSITCLPQDLTRTLAALLDDPDRFRDIGDLAQRFVMEAWNSPVVAERYLRVLREEIPSDWWVDPNDVTYVHGMGMSDTQVKKVVDNLISLEGTGALKLHDRPDLLQMLAGLEPDSQKV